MFLSNKRLIYNLFDTFFCGQETTFNKFGIFRKNNRFFYSSRVIGFPTCSSFHRMQLVTSYLLDMSNNTRATIGTWTDYRFDESDWQVLLSSIDFGNKQDD